MDFGSFLKAPEIKVKIVTYRDIFQDKAMIENRFGEEYRDRSAVIKMDSADLKQLNVKKGETVILKNSFGRLWSKPKNQDMSPLTEALHMPKAHGQICLSRTKRRYEFLNLKTSP